MLNGYKHHWFKTSSSSNSSVFGSRTEQWRHLWETASDSYDFHSFRSNLRFTSSQPPQVIGSRTFQHQTHIFVAFDPLNYYFISDSLDFHIYNSPGTPRSKRRKDTSSRSRSMLKLPECEGNFLEDHVEESLSIFRSNITAISRCQCDTYQGNVKDTTSS